MFFLSVFYLFFVSIAGIYGSFYTAFLPNDVALWGAKIITAIFLLYFFPIGMYFFIKNKEKYAYKFKSKLNVNAFLYLGFPVLILVLAFLNYITFSKAIPSIITAIGSEGYHVNAIVTKKNRWGKRNRHEEIYISGYSAGFPVSRKIYNEVTVGQEIGLTIQKSFLGTRIKFHSYAHAYLKE